MLTNNSKIAKTSSTPGRTRLVNYFNINNQFYLVDLPGYGFNKAGKNLASAWDSVMNDYFVGNPKLKLVLLLVDCRIGLTELDKQMIDYLATNQLPCVIVLTKTDKISRSELNNKIAKTCLEVRFNKDFVVPTSASKKQGSDKIAHIIKQHLE